MKMNGLDIANAIERNAVLSKLRAASKTKLLASATFQPAEAGAVICHQGAKATRFWLLHSGEIKLVRYTSGGCCSLIDIVLPDELIGVVFCSEHQSYPCGAVAMKRSELVSLSTKTLLEELENNP